MLLINLKIIYILYYNYKKKLKYKHYYLDYRTFQVAQINNSKKKIKIKKNGATVVVYGDDLRRIFRLKEYFKIERLSVDKQYVDFIKLIRNQKINIIFSVVGLFNELIIEKNKQFRNYVEIFIKTNIKKIKYKNKKYISQV